MIVECPGCARKLRVGLAHASSYYEESAGLSDLAGSCVRARIGGGGATCAALAKLDRLRAAPPEADSDEAYALNPA